MTGETQTTTLAQLKRAAAKLGVIIEIDGPGSNDEVLVILHAPAGKWFDGYQLHSLGVEYYPSQDRADGKKTDYSASLGDLHSGFGDCTDPDCEYCHPSE